MPDPLTGFHAAGKGLDHSIVKDHETYIQNLSPEEKQSLGPYPASFFKDDTGQHAVRIKTGMDGDSWEHILIYVKNDKRVKTL